MTAFLKVGQFRTDEHEFLGQRNRLGADLL
jgi:hypothetical protein